MKEILDTQVISYALKNKYRASIQGSMISSIVAKEFLLLQDKHPTRARYYIPLLGTGHLSALLLSKRDHPFPKQMTDSVTLDLGIEYGTVVEYSDVAMSKSINNQDEALYFASINGLPREDQRLLRKRFLFLLQNDIRCVPLSPAIIGGALSLLAEFTQGHNIKANFRNTLNDLLIVATALDSGGRLITYDQEVIRFCRGSSVPARAVWPPCAGHLGTH